VDFRLDAHQFALARRRANRKVVGSASFGRGSDGALGDAAFLQLALPQPHLRDRER
jgi:hypothetical protein